MGDLNPLDNTLGMTLADYGRRLLALETVRQPYIADWIQVADTFSATASIYRCDVNVNNPIITTYFQPGTIIRWKDTSSSNFKYAIVHRPRYATESAFYIFNIGSTFSLVNAITEMWFTNGGTHSGLTFPVNIAGSAAWGVTSGTTTFTSTSFVASLTVIGNQIYIDGNANATIATANTTAPVVYFPIVEPTNIGGIFVTNNTVIPVIGSQAGTAKTLKATLGGATIGGNTVIGITIQNVDGTAFVVGQAISVNFGLVANYFNP